MDSNEKFWLYIWIIVALTLCTIVCVPVYFVCNKELEMTKAGYVQKIMVIRPSNDWVNPITEKVWVKVSDDVTLEKK